MCKQKQAIILKYSNMPKLANPKKSNMSKWAKMAKQVQAGQSLTKFYRAKLKKQQKTNILKRLISQINLIALIDKQAKIIFRLKYDNKPIFSY